MENQQNNSESNILQGGTYIRNATRGFGQIGKFWKHYDDLADRTDKEMSKKLNGNLDVLLIFVSIQSTRRFRYRSSLPVLHRLVYSLQ